MGLLGVAFKDALAGNEVLHPNAPAVRRDRRSSFEGSATLNRSGTVSRHASEHCRVARDVLDDPILLSGQDFSLLMFFDLADCRLYCCGANAPRLFFHVTIGSH